MLPTSLEQPGALALYVVLPATCLVGAGVGRFVVTGLGTDSRRQIAPLLWHSVGMCVVCFVFFCWAAYKVLAMRDPDFGVVSFLLAFTINYRTADLCVVKARRPGRASTEASLHSQHFAQTAADLVVACNYLFAMVFISGLPETFQTYLLGGFIFWAAAALRVFRLHSRLAKDRALSLSHGGIGCEDMQDPEVSFI